MKLEKFLAIVLLLIMSICVNAGVLKGVITETGTDEPLIGASVQIAGTTIGAITDFDGNYTMSCADGTYDIEVRYIGYETIVIKGFKIVGEITKDFVMGESSISLADVTVVGKRNLESENMQLLEQRKSTLATQSMGAKELSRKGVSDAEGAVSKISGISKQEGVKNVFVRGLGDRYNSTTLNGLPIPSEDPEYKNIALDLFSSDMIKSVGVNKAFSASGVGDVTGAHIDIQSKELIGDQAFAVDLSGGINTSTVTDNSFLKADGVNYFGIVNNASSPSASLESFDASSWGFSNGLNPTTVASPLINHSIALSGGKRYRFNDDELYFYIVGSHSQSYESYTDSIRDASSTGVVFRDQIGKTSTISTDQLILATLGYNIKRKHNMVYNLMMIHNNEQQVTDFVGKNSETYQSAEDYDFYGITRRQQTNDNLLLVNQILSDWKLNDILNLDVNASHNFVQGLEPDRRINSIAQVNSDGDMQPTGKGTQMRYYSTLRENDFNLQAALTIKLPNAIDNEFSNVKVGYQGRFVQDSFTATEYSFGVYKTNYSYYSIDNMDLDDMFNQERLSNGDFENLTPNEDMYTVYKLINSVYVDGTYMVTKEFTANVGLRYDNVYQAIVYDLTAGGEGIKELTPYYLLPSLNLRYNLNEKNALRLSGSKTYTLPQSKEISPFRYTGTSFDSQGNQNLQPSTNYNVDLKWDMYLSTGELISATGFYKYIIDPISRIDIGSSGGFLSYENIAPYATVAGLEIELRKDIFKIAVGDEGMNKLTFGINGSYTYTHAKVSMATDTTGSQLEGAAPWIVNADLTHTYYKGDMSFTNTVVFNYFSDRVYTIGANGFNDIVEKGVPTLDFVSTSQINKNWAIKFKATNILNATYELSREGVAVTNATTGVTTKNDVILSKYKKGCNLSLGISYTL